jgi:4-oxalocrotonate tautomerase
LRRGKRSLGVSVKNGGVLAIQRNSPSEYVLRHVARLQPLARNEGEPRMPLINVKLIEGVFNDAQKKKMVTDLTDAMVAIEGEAMRQVTWVVIEEVKSGNWALGGKPLTTADVRALQGNRNGPDAGVIASIRSGAAGVGLPRAAPAGFPPCRRRDAEFAFEGSGESSLGIVAAALGDAGDALAPSTERLGREREAPARQIASAARRSNL